MENFSIAVNAVMPLLLYMLIGQGLLRAKLLDGTTYQKLNNAIFRFFLPINLLMNVYEADVRSTFRVDVLLFRCRTHVECLLPVCVIHSADRKGQCQTRCDAARDIPFQFCPVRLADRYFVVVGKPIGDDIDTDCGHRSFE